MLITETRQAVLTFAKQHFIGTYREQGAKIHFAKVTFGLFCRLTAIFVSSGKQ